MKNVIKLSLLVMSISTCFSSHAMAKSVEVLSAVVKGQKISEAQVVVQQNGEQLTSALSDSSGTAVIDSNFPDTNENLIIIKKKGYSTLEVKCPCEGMSYALSPAMEGLDSMRVVLSWGRLPYDLDSHMVYPGNHLFFGQQRGENGNMDVDGTNGYGPETITLTWRKNGQSYIYAVHDHSDKGAPDTQNLSNSQAKVFVYVGESLVRTYYVPDGESGNLWTVFKVNENGAVEDVNSISGVSVDAERIENVVAPLLKNNAKLPRQNWTEAQIIRSDFLNFSGRGPIMGQDYDEALSLFMEAVNSYPENSKAYRNLGFVYKNFGRKAETIWANRNAIARASGKNAASMRAKANFNIGEVYESNNQFNDALEYYKAAKNEKQNPVYDNAILRVSQKIK